MRSSIAALVLVLAVSAPCLSQPDSVFAVSREGVSLLRVNVDGNTGLGNSAPTQRLTVNGGVKADSVTADRVRFADGSAITSTAMEVVVPTLGSGWSNLNSAYGNAAFFKDINGIVHFEGMLKQSGASPSIFTLPVGYRPRNHVQFWLRSNTAVFYQLDISPDGLVTSGLQAVNWFSITGLTFLAGS